MTLEVLPTFESKDPAEAIPLVFDFSPGLAMGETLTGQTASASVCQGADAAPSAILDSGIQFDVTTTKVYVPVIGGLDGVDYLIRVVCPTSNPHKTLVLSGVLPVRQQRAK